MLKPSPSDLTTVIVFSMAPPPNSSTNYNMCKIREHIMSVCQKLH
uniref:Uncharacterized protein n=1 Tax=Anguilla anguilla TaxID=7936 RepID=A0A0E9VGB4_ANGAN